MRHKVFGNQLGRNTNQARALYRSLILELFDHGRIETTVAKAKAVAPMVDRIMNFGKKNTISARKEVIKILGGEKLLHKIFTEIAPKYPDRNSGYSRMIRLGQRLSDASSMAILELVEGKTISVPTVDSATSPVKPESVNKSIKSKKPKSKPAKIGKVKTVKK